MQQVFFLLEFIKLILAKKKIKALQFVKIGKKWVIVKQTSP